MVNSKSKSLPKSNAELSCFLLILPLLLPMLGPLQGLQPNNTQQQNQQVQQQQQSNQQGNIPPPPPQNGQDFTLSSVLHFLQTEWRRYERDRNEWEIERAEMRVRMSFHAFSVSRSSLIITGTHSSA